MLANVFFSCGPKAWINPIWTGSATFEPRGAYEELYRLMVDV